MVLTDLQLADGRLRKMRLAEQLIGGHSVDAKGADG
jgi:hypothetical protein